MSTPSRYLGPVLLVLVACSGGTTVEARPEYLARFQSDPQRRPEVDGCPTCHVAQTGGGARNEFGSAFEAASLQFTPLLRAGFPRYFSFDRVRLPDGTTLAFSDPQGKVVVVQRQAESFAAELAALVAVREPPPPPPANRMTFFVTSRPPETFEKLGGLAGADRHCQALAKAAGADDLVWRAYLSTSLGDRPAINAGDRIGAGPWYNAKGMVVARGPADLHARDALGPELLLSEKGQPILSGDRVSTPDRDQTEAVPIITGTRANGTAAIGQNCANWTSGAGDATAGTVRGTWNSGVRVSCDLRSQPGPPPRFYCFAAK